jgi:polyisoprenyl-teichoic acid--peptidoglycan teichoic acid transferase
MFFSPPQPIAGGSQQRYPTRQQTSANRPPALCGCTCLPIIFLAAFLGLATALYFFSPGRTNVLLLGVDQTPQNSDVGRTDTNILTTYIPSGPYVGMLSIPRDLWIYIAGVGENRINTAHFFAEAAQPGSGPAAAMQAIRDNFGVDVGYYIRVKFEGFRDVFNAMGGVDIELAEPTAGYEAGKHHLTGNKALAFARNRTGSDDFFRMAQGQLILKSALQKMLSPLNWYRLPAVMVALSQAIDTNIPIWLWPRLGFTLVRSGPNGIDNRTIDRNMVIPTITDQGASVLLPIWDQINPVLKEMFGQ